MSVNLRIVQIFQPLLDSSSQIHVRLIDAGSLNHSEARHHLNHLHACISVAKKREEEESGFHNMTDEVNTILGFTVQHLHVQGQVSFAMRLAYSCHLQIRAQFLCVIHPHVSGDTMGPGLIAHSYDSVRMDITNKFKQSQMR